MTDGQLKSFDFSKVEIGGILPQRVPFVMVSRLVSFSYPRTVTEFDVAGENAFIQDGKLLREGLIENVAQTCAARIGFINKYILHKPVNIGYVCAVNDFRISRSPRIGETLVTTIDVTSEFGTILVVSAEVCSDTGIIAEGSMTIALDESRTVEVPEAVVKIADNIISPLGTTTEANYRAVLEGRSALRHYPATRELPEAFFASLIDESSLSEEYASFGIGNGYTRFERRIILSVAKALAQTDLDPASDRVLFVISSTKGNVELLEDPGEPIENERIGVSALKIASFFGNKVTPLVVSNACISGLCAQIAAMRELTAGNFDAAVVTGSDVQSRFIISGFQSFKALSDEACRPFDADRKGLNLGEAAATMIFKRKEPSEGDWCLLRGAIRNDANHISGPSRTGEGSFRALRAALGDFPSDELALVSVHGTSTAYNDEMESIALDRAGLGSVPVNSLKGYYGHTMGAAGILESILSMASIDDGKVLGTRGYSRCGVSCPVDMSHVPRKTDKKAFVKLLSGFGGCNAAALFRKGGER